MEFAILDLFSPSEGLCIRIYARNEEGLAIGFLFSQRGDFASYLDPFERSNQYL